MPGEVPGARPKDVMDILLLSQYFDTLSSVGANSLILEHDPATVANLQQQVGLSFMTGGAPVGAGSVAGSAKSKTKDFFDAKF